MRVIRETYLTLPVKPLFLNSTASEGDLARSEIITLSLSEASEISSRPILRGEGSWISTTVGHDIAFSDTDVCLSVGVDSEPKELSGWYSLTVDSDDILECDREWQELLDDMVV